MNRDDWDVYWVSEEYREFAEGMLRDVEKAEHLLKADVEFEGYIYGLTDGKAKEMSKVLASVTPRRLRAKNPWLRKYRD
jgi:hypothetical protein